MQHTPLHRFHTQLGAKMVDFAGWEMPLLYTSIIEEHLYTRDAASLFDVSHMGRIEIAGAGSEAFLQRVCTRQLADITVNQSRYSHVCNETGGIIDDVIVSRHQDRWLIVCNASNRQRMLDWLGQLAGADDVDMTDTTEQTLMVAVQGPKAIDRLSQMLPITITDLKRYHCQTGSYLFTPYTIFRSGYTGEDGIELILPARVAQFLVGLIADKNEDESGIKPAGLGARDTLRLEAGMPLHGHELHENVDSFSAGLGWCVDLDKEFVGAEALREIAAKGPRRKLVGLELTGRRIARPGATVLDHQKPAGHVTSGTFSPTLERSIAMAYIEAHLAEVGRLLTVDLGGKQTDAAIVRLPFYRRRTA